MLNAVLDHLDLVERAYFGLQYTDEDDQMVCRFALNILMWDVNILFCRGGWMLTKSFENR